MSDDTGNSALLYCATDLIVLCADDPDLLDAIIAWLGRQ